MEAGLGIIMRHDSPTTAMWLRRGPPRCLHSRATCRGGVGGVGVVKAARRRLLMIAIAIFVMPSSSSTHGACCQ